MNALLAHLAYQFKAIIGATIIALIALAEWFVNSPDTAAAFEQIVPAPYAQFVPLALGAIAVIIGHQSIYWKQNAAKPSSEPPITELPTDGGTTLIPVQTPAGADGSH